MTKHVAQPASGPGPAPTSLPHVERYEALASKLSSRAALAREVADIRCHYARRAARNAADAALLDVARDAWAVHARTSARESGQSAAVATRLEAVAARVADHAVYLRARRMESGSGQ